MGTAIGLVARMGPHVTLKQPGSGESLATHIALVIEVVRKDVHGEGRH